MEVAKFVLAAVGTFISVISLSFVVFQYWKKKQDERFDQLKTAVGSQVTDERTLREESIKRLDNRIEFLERSVVHGLENRLSTIEGELKAMKPILQAIQNWFINNTPGR